MQRSISDGKLGVDGPVDGIDEEDVKRTGEGSGGDGEVLVGGWGRSECRYPVRGGPRGADVETRLTDARGEGGGG